MSHRGLHRKTETILMKRTLSFLLAFTSLTIALQAAPTPTPGPKRTSNANAADEIAKSANGWSYVKGEWVHPDGYKYVNGKVLRTTARPGHAFPKPPGKLALENAQRLPAKNAAPANTKTPAEKAAEERQKNLEPRPAPQTGTHL
jgi:hypothetical protein